MNRASLEELLRASAEIVEFERICIIGSASLLVDHPSLGEQGQPLAASLDADFVLLPEDAEKARILLARLGRGRTFASEKGFHADILRPDITELFPPGWEERLEPMPGFAGVFFSRRRIWLWRNCMPDVRRTWRCWFTCSRKDCSMPAL